MTRKKPPAQGKEHTAEKKQTAQPGEGSTRKPTPEEIEELIREYGESPKQRPLRGGTVSKLGKKAGISPKDMTPELIRNWFHYGSPAGHFEHIRAHILTLDEIPNDVRIELELVPKFIEAENYAEVRVRNGVLARWYNDECARLELSSRTENRADRVHQAQFMEWAEPIEPKVARNLNELQELPGFNPKWLDENGERVVRGWARKAGFRFKSGRPAQK